MHLIWKFYQDDIKLRRVINTLGDNMDVMALSCVTDSCDSWRWPGIWSGWCECQEYPPPSPLSSTPPAIQSFQCFTGFIECEMSKYYSLELLSWNKITDWFFILQVSLWIKILFLIWKILGIYDDSEAWSEYKSL